MSAAACVRQCMISLPRRAKRKVGPDCQAGRAQVAVRDVVEGLREALILRFGVLADTDA